MRSYFRNQHRRSGSTPSSESPLSPQWKGPSSPFGSGPGDSANSPASFRPSAIPSPANESPVSPLPPVLPPIPRVASKHEQEQYKTHAVSKSDSGPARERIVVDQPQEVTGTLDRLSDTPPILPAIPRVVTRRFPGQAPLRIKTTDSLKPETGFRRSQPPVIQQEYVGSLQTSQLDSSSTQPHADRNQQRSGGRSLYEPPPPRQDAAYRPSTPPSAPPSNELQLPTDTSSRRASSPSSSFSTFQKSSSSSNFTSDTSTPPSKPVQQSISTSSRPTKPRMNLLNPVTLLRRRRTAQNVENMSDGSLLSHRHRDVPAMNVPDDYDPRIRGKGVHDFNAPRPRRHHSTNDVDSSNIQNSGDTSPVEGRERRKSAMPVPLTNAEETALTEPKIRKTPETEHVAVFHENFDDDSNKDDNSPAINRESLANSSFLARMSRQLDFDSSDFALSNADPIAESQRQSSYSAGERTSKSTFGAPSVRISSDQSTARSSFSNDTRATTPPGSPPSKNQRVSLNLEPPFQPEGLPKHFSSSASRSSRFSFQLNSEATRAEEKALEQKGKEKAEKEQQLDSDAEDDYGSSSGEDVTNYDTLDDGPYEEEIPMVNVVDDDDFYSGLPAQSAEDPVVEQWDGQSRADTAATQQDQQHSMAMPQESQGSDESVDSMYYDDGIIGDPPPNESRGFDESYFDSPNEPQNEEAFAGTYTGPGPSIENGSLSFQSMGGATASDHDHDNFMSVNSSKALPDIYSAPEGDGERAPFGKLNEYHNALASAATRAEADGRFHRKPSVDISASDVESDGGLQMAPHQPAFDIGTVDWTQSNFDDEDLDGLDDDQMVAAANAEVLASEDSEFYGREFGFYGGSTGSDFEMYSGGYFGPGPDDLKRSVSGMNASREPNLTPITERSEFSTRNSFISLHGYGSNPSAPNSAISRNDLSLPSPVLGLKELAASMSMNEDDMTLSQLIKLRKETFGGSGGSAMGSPSTSFSNGSPLALQNPPPPVQTVEEEDHGEQAWSTDRDYYREEYSPDTPHDNSLPLRASQYSTSNSSETTPKPPSAIKNPNLVLAPNGASNGSSPLSTPSTAFLTSSHSPKGSNVTGPVISPSSSSFGLPSPASIHSAPTSPIPMPMPSPSLRQKFASRPPASSATYAERDRQRNSLSNANTTGTGDSVAYVLEDSNWYLERRRRLSNGELIVVGREMVEGGRI